MPETYRIKLSDGRTFNVQTEGGPPTEQDVLANLDKLTTEPTFKSENQKDAEGNAVVRGASAIGATAADVAIGAAKGAANTAIGLGDLFYHVPGIRQASDAVSRHVFGQEPTDVDTFAAARKEFATPEGTAQKAGYYGEQLAEFFVPAGSGERAASWLTAKLSPYLSNASRAVRIAVDLAPRMAAEGATAAGITAAQGGNATEAGVVGAAVPVVGKAGAPVANVLRRSAGRGVSKFLQPTTKVLKAEARRVEPGILERNIIGTQQSVLGRATSETGTAGRAVQRAEAATAAANPGDVVPVQSMLDAVDRVLRGTVTTNAQGATVVRPGKEALNAAAEYYRNWLADQGTHISVEKAGMLKRDFQEVARAAQQYLADDPTKAKGFVARKAGAAVRQELLKVNPDLQKVWAEYGFWAGLEDVLKATTDRVRPQAGWGKKILAATVMSAVGGTATAMREDNQEGALAASLVGALALAVQTPTWKLASAQVKSSIADALVRGQTARLRFLLGRVAPAAVSAGTR